MSIAEILDRPDYGPAPESDKEARQWLARHGEGFSLFIDGGWRTPDSGRWFETIEPGTGSFLARVAEPGRSMSMRL